ncbi:hypothetical protein EIP86_006686 [Pleurotus ostreatoroseus]|nr:hypothetical protein EIP86_006686 [Pleurotus ostreatoroseus]
MPSSPPGVPIQTAAYMPLPAGLYAPAKVVPTGVELQDVIRDAGALVAEVGPDAEEIQRESPREALLMGKQDSPSEDALKIIKDDGSMSNCKLWNVKRVRLDVLKKFFAAEASDIAIPEGPRFEPIHRDMDSFDKDRNEFNDMNKAIICQQVHTEYEAAFPHLTPTSVPMTPTSPPSTSTISLALSLSVASCRRSRCSSHEDDILGPNEADDDDCESPHEVKPLLEEKPLENDPATDAIALALAPKPYVRRSRRMRCAQDIPLAKS